MADENEGRADCRAGSLKGLDGLDHAAADAAVGLRVQTKFVLDLELTLN